MAEPGPPPPFYVWVNGVCLQDTLTSTLSRALLEFEHHVRLGGQVVELRDRDGTLVRRKERTDGELD